MENPVLPITPNPLEPAGYGGVESDSTKSVPYHTHDGLNSPKLSSVAIDIAAANQVFIPAEAMNPTTTAPCADLTKVEAGTNDVDYWVLDFDSSTDESCFFTLAMPRTWNGGSVNFVFYWTATSGSSGNTVAWGIKGRAYGNGTAIDQNYGNEIIDTDSLIATGAIHITNGTGNVSLAGSPLAGQWCQFKITRKTANDNLANDARLIGLMMGYSV